MGWKHMDLSWDSIYLACRKSLDPSTAPHRTQHGDAHLLSHLEKERQRSQDSQVILGYTEYLRLP